jgi:cell division protein FtsQ
MTTRDAAQSLTRADRIRLQRAHEERLRDQAPIETQPRMRTEAPPVVQRGNMGTPISQRSKQSQAKRKYSIPTGNFGAELVMPAIPEIRFGWRILSGLIFATMLFMLFSMSAGSHFRVQEAAIIGNQRISSTDINLILDVADTPIFMIDLQKVKNTLAAAYPELSHVAVSVTMPNQLNIEVEERNPAIAWQMEGQTFWIDASGVVFQARGELVPTVTIQSKSLPPVQAERLLQTDSAAQLLPSQLIKQNDLANTVNVHTLDKNLLDAATNLSGKLPAGTVLVYTDNHGLGWQAEQGWQVFFGTNLDDINAKMTMYESVVNNLSTQNITPGMISIEYIHAPYYRMEHIEW